MAPQKTISRPVSVEGKGLFSGQPCRLTFVPADENTGVAFARAAEPDARIPADVAHARQREHRTSLTDGAVTIETVEHVLSAVWGTGLDNVVIQVDADEVPSSDGSAKMFVDALGEAGVRDQRAASQAVAIDRPITVSQDSAMLAALPGPADCLEILYDLDYSQAPSIGRQAMSFRLGVDDFAGEIAPARTFATEPEARQIQAAGMCTHLTAADILVIGENGPIDNELRFDNEPVRHKICDLIGDLALLGRRLTGRIVACRSGHELNVRLVRELATMGPKAPGPEPEPPPMMDIRRIMRLLPHRYPCLMVDRIVRIEGDTKAIGIKNVSINEPFFQGHYPGQPIMPGVMILESLAQLSGILLSRRLEHTGKVAVLLSMDRVKMRRPVQPGDQLILEAEALHVRTRTGHCRCRAEVNGQLAAEAEIKFMLVDAEPI